MSERAKRIRECIGAVSNLVTAGVALAALIVAGLTLYRSQRAWIAPESVSIVGEPVLGKPITLLISFENVGKEPATKVILVRPQISFIPLKLGHKDIPYIDEKFSWPAGLHCPTDGVELKDGATYFPLQSSGRYQHVMHVLTGGQTNGPSPEMFAKTQTLLIRGCVYYYTTSLFGTTSIHSTAYCFYLYPFRKEDFWKGIFSFCPVTGTAN